MSIGWTARDMPDLTGRTAVVTGASSGIGEVTAAELARHGAAVTLAVRDPARGDRSAERIRTIAPAADVQVSVLDLADLGSVRRFADDWSREHPEGLDLLVNNAGVMAVPRRQTADGFELQLGTNHLGHFALTGRLLPALVARPRSRVVTVSSNAHRMGRIHFDDLQGARRYGPWRAYAQSKLANLLFTAELDRRARAAGVGIRATAAHPGLSSTHLVAAGPAARYGTAGERVSGWVTAVLGQSATMGALPTLFAATTPDLPPAAYVGPGGVGEQRGYPRLVGRSAAAADLDAARRLWDVSEDLTGVRYPLDDR